MGMLFHGSPGGGLSVEGRRGVPTYLCRCVILSLSTSRDTT